MRRIEVLLLVALLVVAASACVSAEEQKGGMMGKGMMPGGMMGEQGMMGEEGPAAGKGKMMGMGGTCGMMTHSMMMGKSVATTSDGGVIVLIGNKLKKYDQDLVLKKEVEIDLDMEGMQKMMMQMMEKCPGYEKMMPGGMMGKDRQASPEESAEMSGQEAHH